jgi:hypothetical protein
MPQPEQRISLPKTLVPHSGQSNAPLGEIAKAPQGQGPPAGSGAPQA